MVPRLVSFCGVILVILVPVYAFTLSDLLDTYDLTFSPEPHLNMTGKGDSVIMNSSYAYTYDTSGKIMTLSFTIFLNISDDVTVTAAIHDSDDRFVKSYNKYIEVGSAIINIDISGTDVYERKMSGPFYLRYFTITKDDTIIESVTDLLETNITSYSDYSVLDLPDITLKSHVSGYHLYGIPELSYNLTVTNNGDSTAYNFQVCTFNNLSYKNCHYLWQLAPGQSKTYHQEVSPATDMRLIFYADYGGTCDESDKTNNIIEKEIHINRKPVLAIKETHITITEHDDYTFIYNVTGESDLMFRWFLDEILVSENETFTFYGNYRNAGNYRVRLTVSDGYRNATATWNLSVNDTLTIDSDNDRIDDTIDTFFGDPEFINTTHCHLAMRIGNLTNLSQAFTGSRQVTVMNASRTLLEFPWNFSKHTLNITSDMLIDIEPANSSFGYTIIKGLMLDGSKKNVTVSVIDTTKDAVCVRDAVVTKIDEVTDSCTDTNEHLIVCDGTMYSNYTCTRHDTFVKVTGLSHSAVKQVSYESSTFGSDVSGSSYSASGISSVKDIDLYIDFPEHAEASDIDNLQKEYNISGPVPVIKSRNTTKKKSAFTPSGMVVHDIGDADPVIGFMLAFSIILVGYTAFFYLSKT